MHLLFVYVIMNQSITKQLFPQEKSEIYYEMLALASICRSLSLRPSDIFSCDFRRLVFLSLLSNMCNDNKKNNKCIKKQKSDG
uniref:Ovule protein n=1 Tax=Romanomermis culicivorax TaxID=13658 RepID=A0A915K438_ROMCU